ncbi:hypothetical protein [Tenacibaculum maritimum]|uniref:hypothetical protein n=1 Tax=Tenacibaculum maritimum TaxID=107401 RepID=UPI00388EFD78
MKQPSNKYLIFAVLIGIVFHGTSIFFTLENTYDALIHLFFAEHYASNWFEPWNFKWYTGFTVMSYPPLVHQSIAALSLIGGLKFGLFVVTIIEVLLFITGVYRFAFLITANKKASGYASVLAVFSSSFVETLHIFGQLPSIVGISVLMHALPEVYMWLRTGKYNYLFISLSLISVTVTSHHVTSIFGIVFFIFPLIGMAVMDASREQVKTVKMVTFKLFFKTLSGLFKRIISFVLLSLVVIIGAILPYWIDSRNNPITQVPIPHGSRDNFIEISSSGLVFFIIPWGILLFIFPYFFYRYFTKRYLFFGLSFSMLFLLGTGGTTPIPRIILGDNAFNILTLDRFTLWASIMSLPLFGEFVCRFIEGDLKKLIQKKFGRDYYRLIGGVLAGSFLFMTVFTISLGYFRPLQPQKIKMLPIVNFLNQDQHDQWRYLTLGFGDQMAWLSALTNAMTVDGNYHSARRLPELTTRSIERLENSKFKGIAGIGSLQQFLTTPEKYNLKYIFSNDKFYDPILYFCGWQRLSRLENGVLVWEKMNVPPIATIIPKEHIATWLRFLWGIVPFLTLVVAFLLNLQSVFNPQMKVSRALVQKNLKIKKFYSNFSEKILKINHIWAGFLIVLILYSMYIFYLKNDTQRSPENVIEAYYDALDFNKFEKAHRLINPQKNISIAQYMLEISVTDGLLNSYAKLDALETEVTKRTPHLATLKVKSYWITPLERINKIDYKTVIKLDGKWFIEPDDIDLDLPPDQLYTDNSTTYFNQGRKRITTEQTHHEDVLKQPVLEILSAKLVNYKSHYAIIGEIQNIDNVPADVVLKGTLYNEENKELASYNAKYHMKHKLMPKEITSFRINFEGIAWSRVQDSIPKTFNPDEFTPIQLEEQPTKFNIHAAGNVSGADLHKSVTLSEVNVYEKMITGNLFNSGIQEITIPQLIFTYYDDNKNMLWVDHLFLGEGIRQQRKQYFEYELLDDSAVDVINSDMTYCFVNGLPNENISNQMVPNRIQNHTNNKFQKIVHPIYKFVKIEMNSYIGEPK